MNQNIYGDCLGQAQGGSSPFTNEEMQYIALNGKAAFAEREARKLSVKELERLRDEFAMAVDIKSACDSNGYIMGMLAKHLIGESTAKNNLESQIYFDRAELAYRYMKADLMLKAREQSK